MNPPLPPPRQHNVGFPPKYRHYKDRDKINRRTDESNSKMISANSTNSFENTSIHYIRVFIHVLQSTEKDMVVNSTAHSELTEVNHERTVRESDLGVNNAYQRFTPLTVGYANTTAELKITCQSFTNRNNALFLPSGHYTYRQVSR